ncbi:MAG: YebC/PmpR family DNA-binding regulatory protein [Candidatus Omnitrophota bacterium]|jgi:YebC/PmpR family DNA-binding regulatory protein
MSGHSKWATIKHKKGATDAKRGKIFSKMVKEITVAARDGGDMQSNARLRVIVQKAKDANMPAENIDRAVKKGTGELPGVVYEEMVYEGYAPCGVALLIQTLSDNKNRTSSEVRSTLDKRGGKMANPGAVAYLFHHKGVILIESSKADEETLMDLVLNAGAEDMVLDGEIFEVTAGFKEFEAVRKAIEGASIEFLSAELAMVPDTSIKIEAADAPRILALVEALEDLDDVQTVSANFDIPDELLEA